ERGFRPGAWDSADLVGAWWLHRSLGHPMELAFQEGEAAALPARRRARPRMAAGRASGRCDGFHLGSDADPGWPGWWTRALVQPHHAHHPRHARAREWPIRRDARPAGDRAARAGIAAAHHTARLVRLPTRLRARRRGA